MRTVTLWGDSKIYFTDIGELDFKLWVWAGQEPRKRALRTLALALDGPTFDRGGYRRIWKSAS